MKCILSVAAAVVLTCLISGSAFAAGQQQDFSKLDPAWAAQQMDASLQSSELGSAWAALKVVFPGDYKQLTQDLARAVIQHEDWSGRSQMFIQTHVAGQVQAAQQAPAQEQAKYQRQKADFLVYLSHVNTSACAYLGTGIGDPSSLGNLNSDQMKRYSNLIAVAVEAIGAGRRSPVTYGALTPEDASQIRGIMASQGVSDADAQSVLSGQIGKSPGELCRAGVIRNSALAAAPAEIVAKVAFR